MNALNHVVTAVFDVLLWPLEKLGPAYALVIASGLFGVLALIAFKYISRQQAIARVKNKIKAHLIEIRIYADDPRLVSRAIGKTLMRNVQYLTLNLLPFVPLSIPFTFVVAQCVVRYAFAPVPLHASATGLLAGQGTTLNVALSREFADQIKGLTIHFPDGLRAVSPLVRNTSEGRAWQEFIALTAGVHTIEFSLADGTRAGKLLAAGAVTPRQMQPVRGRGFWSALLWPAEDAFEAPSPFAQIEFVYPDADLGWLPSGAGGVLLVFVLSSMLFGLLALKPFKIQI
ncbi:MAG: hypothetical protein JNL28_00265 [Planctomycetes bacterium]|nr:hypothetical protein [Planctomycetota bacterium]